MAKTFLLGMNAKLYYGPRSDTPATLSPASMTVAGNVKDLTLTMEAGEADVTTRANSGWRATAPTLRECTVEFQMQFLPEDAAFLAIRTAFMTAGEIALAPLTDVHTEDGAFGPVGNFTITGFSSSQPLEEAITVDVTAKLSAFGSLFEG